MATILVVEDELSHLFVEAIRLMDKGRHTIVTAGRGDEAVRKARALRPDAIVMDLRLPFMSGLEAIQEIRKFSNVPILAITAFANQYTRQRTLEVGATDYLTKPVSLEELQRRVEAMLTKKPVSRQGDG
jgi:two-component system OmpR family response regulator